PVFALEAAHEAAQARHLVHRYLKQALDLVGDVPARGDLIADGRQLILEADVRLDDAVVDVAREPLALLLGCVRGEPGQEPDVVYDRHHLLDDLHQQVYVRAVEDAPARRQVKPAHGLTAVVQGHGNEGLHFEPRRQRPTGLLPPRRTLFLPREIE